ncbi:MAG: bifunctional nuclease family protein [Armatimonadota bacterium]|nr:bifunctional nuclease family protein [Armatimonadota bacterium]
MVDEFGFQEEEPEIPDEPFGGEGFAEGEFKDAKPPEGFPEDRGEPLEEHEVKVMGVYEQQEQGGRSTAFVLLRDTRGRSVLIQIGRFEALAISVALEGKSADRPMTHDLMNNMVNRLGGKVDRILVDDLFNSTYYAKIDISVNGKTVQIDSRPSDAIALGIRAKAPIFMAESVLREAAVQEEF